MNGCVYSLLCPLFAALIRLIIGDSKKDIAAICVCECTYLFLLFAGFFIVAFNFKEKVFFIISFKKFANIQRFKFVPVFVVNVNHDVITSTLMKLYSETVSPKNHPRRPQPELWQSSNHPDQHGQNQGYTPHGG